VQNDLVGQMETGLILWPPTKPCLLGSHLMGIGHNWQTGYCF